MSSRHIRMMRCPRGFVRIEMNGDKVGYLIKDEDWRREGIHA